MKKFLLSVLAVAAFAACTTDFTEELSVVAPQKMTIVAEADDTRMQLMDGLTVWNEDDLVSVFYKTDGNEIWRCYEPTGSRKAELVNKYDNNGRNAIDNIIVFYPHESENRVNGAGDSVIATISDSQYYAENSYGLKSSPMIGLAQENEDGDMYCTLRNVFGWIKLSLTGTTGVGRISVKGNNGEILAGLATINAEQASLEFDASAAFKTIALKCPGFVQLSDTATDFYIALPPMTFTKGLTVEVYDNADKKMTKVTNREIVIERNAILPMEAFAANCNETITKSVTAALVSTSFNEIKVNVQTEGYPSYIIGALSSISTSALSDDETVNTITENLKSSFENWNSGYGVFGKEVMDATYSGNLLGFGESYYSTLYPGTTYMLYILPLEDGKSRGEDGVAGDYKFEDIKTWVFSTNDITSGGTSTVTMEAIETSYKNIEVAITGDDNTAMIYAMSLTEADFKKLPFAQTKLDKLFATCKETPDPLIQSGNKHTIVLSGYEPGTSGYVMAVAVDKSGKYGTLVYQKFTTKTIEYSTTMSVTIDEANSKAEWTTANMKFNVQNGTAVSYMYLSMPMSTLNLYKYTEAQLEEMMVLNNNYYVKSISASELVDGGIQIGDLSLDKEYKFGVMAIDAQGTPSHAAFTTFTPTVPEYTFITATSDEQRYLATKPTFDYSMTWDSYNNCIAVTINVVPAEGTAKYWVGCYNSTKTGEAAFKDMITSAGTNDNARTRAYTEAATRVAPKVYDADACIWITWQDKDGNYYECISEPIFTQKYVASSESTWKLTKPTVQMSIDANGVLSYTVTPSASAVDVYILAFPSGRYNGIKLDTYQMTINPEAIKTNNQPYSGTLEGAQSNATVVVAWTDKSGNLYEAAKFSLE